MPRPGSTGPQTTQQARPHTTKPCPTHNQAVPQPPPRPAIRVALDHACMGHLAHGHDASTAPRIRPAHTACITHPSRSSIPIARTCLYDPCPAPRPFCSTECLCWLNQKTLLMEFLSNFPSTKVKCGIKTTK